MNHDNHLGQPTTLVANGPRTSTITVQAKDANGNNLTASGGAVTLHPTLGTIGTVTNNNNGTYTATLTAGNRDGYRPPSPAPSAAMRLRPHRRVTLTTPTATPPTRSGRRHEFGEWYVQHVRRNGDGHERRHHGKRFRSGCADRGAIWI